MVFSKEPVEILRIEKCPVCQCKETVAGKERDLLVKEGKFNKDTPVMLWQVATAVVDPTRISKTLVTPVIQAQFDVCAECGCFYAVRVVKTMGMVQIGPPPGQGFPGQQLPPFFGNPGPRG